MIRHLGYSQRLAILLNLLLEMFWGNTEPLSSTRRGSVALLLMHGFQRQLHRWWLRVSLASFVPASSHSRVQGMFFTSSTSTSLSNLGCSHRALSFDSYTSQWGPRNMLRLDNLIQGRREGGTSGGETPLTNARAMKTSSQIANFPLIQSTSPPYSVSSHQTAPILPKPMSWNNN
jgi:hypothetical protein